MLKNIGWLISVMFFVLFILFIVIYYLPTKREIRDMKNELSMWEEMVKKEGEHIKSWQFDPETFFDRNEIAPHGEIALARIFNSLEEYADGKTILISASGKRDQFFEWYGRIDRTIMFIVKNCSINPSRYRFQFIPSNEESFEIHIDD